MIRGLYTSALGMTVQMQKMDVVSNNIANADTTGFKKDEAVTQSFSDELLKRIKDTGANSVTGEKRVGDMSLGIFVDNVYTDFSSGSLRQTGGPLELAISGTGFFSVSVTDRAGNETEKYTRDGSFTLTSDRQLVTKEGNYVLGQNGRITVPDGEIAISGDGAIKVNGELVERIKMTDFENPESLRKSGDNLYNVTDESETRNFSGVVVQGYLENSNVNSVREMVDMIALSRAYEANQKLVSIHDTLLGRAVSDIARRS